MATLVRRFVCGTCGGTAAAPGCPFQRCTSCNTISDYDFGVARTLADWPAHEARLGTRFARHSGELAVARRRGDKAAYATAYANILRPLMQEFPALYPPGIAEAAYLDGLTAFYGAWQAHTAIDAELVRLDAEYRARRDAVVHRGERAEPRTLWPLIDTAIVVADLQQRLCASDPGPPSDFIATFVRRFSLAITAAEWLPQLEPGAQRALVERLGVTTEYVAAAQTIACGNCGGDVEITPGFLAMACPYCSAEILEARPDYRPVEADRAAFGDNEHALKLAIQRAGAALTHLAILDGPVTREGRPLRLAILRAHTARGSQDALEILEAADSPLFTDLLAWADAYTADRDVTCRMLRYREHPRCGAPFDLDELARRYADVAPPPGAVRSAASAGMTVFAEVSAGDTVTRLAVAEGAQGAERIRRWLRS